LRNFLEYGAVRVLLGLLEYSPLPVARGLSRGCFRMLDRAVPRLRGTALRNLALAMPDTSIGQREQIVDGLFESLGRSLLVFARLPQLLKREQATRWISYEGFQHFEQAMSRGKGVLFATAHLGNWELSAFAHALLSAPMSVLVRPLDNPYLDRMVERRRSLSGNRVIAKKDSARDIMKALRRNEAVGILVDQNTSADEGVFVNFFGVKACATAGLARIAAHTGAAVIPGFAIWRPDLGRYVLEFCAPVPITGDTPADTQAIQSALEAVIRRYPGQWLWLHRRWKTRPPGEPDLYS
jgi:Kdo2-lipid IVA lauroyltransferase/acyltransferase